MTSRDSAASPVKIRIFGIGTEDLLNSVFINSGSRHRYVKSDLFSRSVGFAECGGLRGTLRPNCADGSQANTDARLYRRHSATKWFNVWVQPVDGSAGYPITDFKSEQIWSFSLSPDGKSLAVLRGHYDSDVVLLQETKP
jgi:hypothetical protein